MVIKTSLKAQRFFPKALQCRRHEICGIKESQHDEQDVERVPELPPGQDHAEQRVTCEPGGGHGRLRDPLHPEKGALHHLHVDHGTAEIAALSRVDLGEARHQVVQGGGVARVAQHEVDELERKYSGKNTLVESLFPNNRRNRKLRF